MSSSAPITTTFTTEDGSSTSSTTTTTTTTLIVCPTKSVVKHELCQHIARISILAIKERQQFIIALSGGSLPSLLDGLLELSNNSHNNNEDLMNLQFDKWWILLADERVVPLDNEDSNLGSIMKNFVDKLSTTTNNKAKIPPSQIIGIDQKLLSDNKDNLDTATALIADDYESQLNSKLGLSVSPSSSSSSNDSNNTTNKKTKIDLAVLGFGPDGHTCSLFPGHPLVTTGSTTTSSSTSTSTTDYHGNNRLIAPIVDSPKLPPHRITLTMKALDLEHTRNIIVCGTGTSKYPIISNVFETVDNNVNNNKGGGGQGGEEKVRPSSTEEESKKEEVRYYTNVKMVPLSQTTYPSAMVGRQHTSSNSSASGSSSSSTTLTWLIDQDAFDGGGEGP